MKSNNSTEKGDPTATLRQQRRRKRLKEAKGRLLQVALSEERTEKLDQLLISGYAADQTAALSKAIDEAFEREIGEFSNYK